MSNQKLIKNVMENEEELQTHISNLYNLAEIKIEMKTFYKEQLGFLRKEFKNQRLTKEEFDQKVVESTNLYSEYVSKIKDYLDLNYSLAIWEYNQSNLIKNNLNYIELKAEYQVKLESLKQENNKDSIKKVKQDYSILKKTLKPRNIAFIAILGTISLLIISLIVNYLYYFKVANNGETFSFKDKDQITAFIFMCIGVCLIIGFLVFIITKTTKRIFLDKEENLFKTSSIGFIGSFTDTIGVGSFAVTVAALNATNTVKNVKNLPGTLNIGLTIPNLLAGTLFVSAIQVELVTLISLVISAMIGAFLAAKIVNLVNKKVVALFVSVCLAIAGILMILAQVGLFENAGTKGLSGWKLGVGILAFFIIGGLQSFGIGLYAPALAIVSLLGMETIIAFPIMTCAAGFALPTTAWTFHRDNNYNPKVAYGLLIGGVFGTVFAFFTIFVGIQGGLNIKMNDFTYYLKWFAVIVMYYASFMLFRKFLALRKESLGLVKTEPENYYEKYGTNYLIMLDKNFSSIMDSKQIDITKINLKIDKNKIEKKSWK